VYFRRQATRRENPDSEFFIKLKTKASFTANGAFLSTLSQKAEFITELVRKILERITMKSNFLEIRNALEECPKCGKHSLAQQGHDKYHCLWCGFYRDISQPSGEGLFLAAVIFAVVLLVSLASQSSWQPNNLSTPESSNGSAVEVLPDSRFTKQK
jgi:ribosomal protein S27AE